MTSNFIFPEATVQPLRGGPVLGWGIAGTGEIAAYFADALGRNTDQRLRAVGSRNPERGQSFARKHGADKAHASYRELVEDPAVDIVYVATPNSEHRPIAELALHAGKHVLVEKPFGIDVNDARSIANTAAAANLFAMEAMWSRFLPHTAVISDLLDGHVLGDLGFVSADFGEDFGPGRTSAVFRQEMGGGAIRDIGVYPVWFTRFVLGQPDKVRAIGPIDPSGVDNQVAAVFGYVGGAHALINSTMLLETPSTASIAGTKGRIDVQGPFLKPTAFTLTTASGTHEWRDTSGIAGMNGLAWEAVAIAAHIHDGLVESPLHPLSVSLEITATLDELRKQVYRGSEG